MKRIAAVVRPEKLEPLKEALFQANISGMTIYQVHGCGNQHGWKEYFRGSEVFLNMIPKVKFEIVVESNRVDEIVNLITDIARTGQVGDGKIFVSEIERVIRVRTGKKTKRQCRVLPRTYHSTTYTVSFVYRLRGALRRAPRFLCKE